MGLTLVKVSETQNKITLAWTRPEGQACGALYDDRGLRAQFGKDASRATFEKGHDPYEVAALCRDAFGDFRAESGVYGAPPSGLPFALPVLRPGYATLKGAGNFGSSSQAVNGGEDCLIDLEGTVRTSSTTVWHKADQRIQIKTGRWRDTKTGLVIRSMDGVGAEHVSATDMRGQNLIDGFIPAGNPNSPATKVTLQLIRTDVPNVNVDDGGEHADAVQTQGLLRRLEIGMSTFWLLGVSGGSGHPGKGLMLNTFSQAPFEVDLDQVNYRSGPLLTGAAIFKAYQAISMRTHEVYYDGPYWGTSRCLFPTPTFSGDTASWPASENWDGAVKRGVPAGGDFCA